MHTYMHTHVHMNTMRVKTYFICLIELSRLRASGRFSAFSIPEEPPDVGAANTLHVFMHEWCMHASVHACM